MATAVLEVMKFQMRLREPASARRCRRGRAVSTPAASKAAPTAARIPASSAWRATTRPARRSARAASMGSPPVHGGGATSCVAAARASRGSHSTSARLASN